MLRKLVRLVAIAALGCIFSVSISTAIFFVTRAVRPVFDFLVQYYPYIIAIVLFISILIYLIRKHNEARERERRLQREKEFQELIESDEFRRYSACEGRASRVLDESRASKRVDDENILGFLTGDSIAEYKRSIWKEVAQIFLEAMLLLFICIALITPAISIVLYIFFGVPAKIATVSSTISCFIISLSATFLCSNWFNSVGEKASFVIAATCLSPTIIPLFPQLNYFNLW